MSYTIDKAEQLAEAHKRGYFAQKASLQAQGVPTRQHNAGAKKVAKKSAAKKVAKKSTAKKTTAKKTAAKKS